MYAAMTLCGQKERRPHLTGGGNFPEATPHHQVEGATPINFKTSGKGNRGSGVDEIWLDIVFIARLSLVIELA
jgi:hypothetical protein